MALLSKAPAGAVFGVRRVLMISASVFALSNLLPPFPSGVGWVLAFQMISDITAGGKVTLGKTSGYG
jgi:hypothetical protein